MDAIFDYCQGCRYKKIREIFGNETIVCKNKCSYGVYNNEIHILGSASSTTNALKTAINSVYGLTSASFENALLPIIERVIFNDPATIVFWSDGTKTVVKAQDGEEFDPEKGLAMAITKKKFGNKGDYYNHIKKWVEPYYKKNKIEE